MFASMVWSFFAGLYFVNDKPDLALGCAIVAALWAIAHEVKNRK